MNYRIYSDFDGTMTGQDTLVLLLDRFGRRLPDGSDWRSIEFDPDRCELDKLQAEMDLLDCSLEEALAYLDATAVLRAGLEEFLAWVTAGNAKLHVLSGGLLPIIRRTMSRLPGAPLVLEANDLKVEAGRWIVLPHQGKRIRGLCNHCKTRHLHESSAQGLGTVYVGDGSTDFCPSREANLVFARDSLARQLKSEGRDFHHFDSFHQVLGILQAKGIMPVA